MNKKLRTLLADKCKDFGLTDKALDELASLVSEGISEESTEEDISAKVDSVIPFARAMQAEITRKSQKRTKSGKAQSQETDGAGDGGDDKKDDNSEDVPAWMESYMKPFKESLKKLQDENESLKAEKAASERTSKITSKAKELGIPEEIMKHFSLSEDADIDAELNSFKQVLVNNNLVPRDAALETSSMEAAFKEDAKTWAESLPNK